MTYALKKIPLSYMRYTAECYIIVSKHINVRVPITNILSPYKQCHGVKKESFHVLRVGEDNVQMSKFIKNELGSQTFENGRAFYEFNRKEDLNYYKEVVKVQRNQV